MVTDRPRRLLGPCTRGAQRLPVVVEYDPAANRSRVGVVIVLGLR